MGTNAWFLLQTLFKWNQLRFQILSEDLLIPNRLVHTLCRDDVWEVKCEQET